MNTTAKRLLAGFALTLAFTPVLANEPERGEVVGGVVHSAPSWFKESFLEIADDVDEAASSGKHVLLFFQLNGCPYCHRMLTEVFETEPYKSYMQEHFDVIAINVRGDRDIAFTADYSATEKELSEKLNVWATPGIVFLNDDNQQVVRVDGYRAPERMRQIAEYVATKAYENQSLADYLDANLKGDIYALRDHPVFTDVSDLSKVSGPLAVIFEDSSCNDCAEFHDRTLADSKVQAVLKDFTVVRLDAASDTPITTPEGESTTPAAWAKKLKMTYRPGVLLFADNQLLRRYDSFLYRHHFREGFLWIASGSYKTEDYSSYSDRRTEELLSAGETIDLSR